MGVPPPAYRNLGCVSKSLAVHERREFDVKILPATSAMLVSHTDPKSPHQSLCRHKPVPTLLPVVFFFGVVERQWSWSLPITTFLSRDLWLRGLHDSAPILGAHLSSATLTTILVPLFLAGTFCVAACAFFRLMLLGTVSISIPCLAFCGSYQSTLSTLCQSSLRVPSCESYQ